MLLCGAMNVEFEYLNSLRHTQAAWWTTGQLHLVEDSKVWFDVKLAVFKIYLKGNYNK